MLTASAVHAAQLALLCAQTLDGLEADMAAAQREFTKHTDEIRELTGLRFTEYYRPHGWCWRRKHGGYSASRPTRAECIAALIDSEIRWI